MPGTRVSEGAGVRGRRCPPSLRRAPPCEFGMLHPQNADGSPPVYSAPDPPTRAQVPTASPGCDPATHAQGPRPAGPLPEPPGSQLSSLQTKAGLDSKGGEPWCRAGGGMPVDMFGQGPGRGPGLSHSCWVHRRGTVQRQGKPAATAGVLGSWVTGGGFLSNRPSRALPSSTVLPPGLSPEIIPVLSSRKCRGKA